MGKLSVNNLILPAFSKISKTFNLEAYLDTRKGSQMIATINRRQKIAKIINYATITLAVFFGIVNYFGVNNGKIFQALVSGGLLYGVGILIKYLYTNFMISPVKTNYVNNRSKYAFEMAQTMVEHFGGYFYTFGDGYFFVYNPELCIYVNAENGEWIGYDSASIKSVELSHVHIGSSTVSQTSTSGVGIAWSSNIGTYHGSSTTHSETTSHYEWRFDIFSGFLDYPNVTMVFPDNAEGEDFAKKAKALLS